MTTQQKRKKNTGAQGGRLRIGDNWHAITIIALSQNNPLKAIAEFVENSIDAKARNISVIRGKAKGENYLKIIDDGEGVPLDENGAPNFKYVATHICDSIKRKLKQDGASGIQGEFGIGLLSFWTVGETLTMSGCGRDNRAYHMRMIRNQPGYSIAHRQLLTPFCGTELVISPLLPGLRQVNGEKIQRYLASELRDRIRQSQVKIKVIDHMWRGEYAVEPRQFSGQLIHQLPALSTEFGDIYAELYFNSPDAANTIGLYRSGTRVLTTLTQLDEFSGSPWGSGYLQGIVDAPFFHLTPGTRDGIIRDQQFEAFCQGLQPLREHLLQIIDEQKQAQEERSSKEILKSVQLALKEAILNLPQEEYDWFDVHAPKSSAAAPVLSNVSPSYLDIARASEGNQFILDEDSGVEESSPQKQFFDFAGPLRRVNIAPSVCTVAVNTSRNFRAVCRDHKRRSVDQNLSFQWSILEGAGTLLNADGAIVTFQAPMEPCLCRMGIKVWQNEVVCEAEALITVTDSLIDQNIIRPDGLKKGLPGYTLKSAAGELWRSRYDLDQNVVVINNAHRDFVFAFKEKSRKLRYICRLFTKELILANFLNADNSQLLERMIELSLYTEESLK